MVTLRAEEVLRVVVTGLTGATELVGTNGVDGKIVPILLATVALDSGRLAHHRAMIKVVVRVPV